jgi:predicted component of type VI protein secretion system
MSKKLFSSISLLICLTISVFLIIGCGGGNSNPDSTPPVVTPAAPPATPEVPTLVAADKQLSISWKAVDGATVYQVYYSATNDSSTGTLYDVVTDTKCVINGLANDTTYFVWIKAQNSAGSSDFSPVASATPTVPIYPPAAPVIVHVTAGDKQLILNWPAVIGATDYEVWYSDKNDSGTAGKSTNTIDDTTCTLTSLTNGTTYYVWVKAKNKAGTSDFSPVASGKPILPKVNLTVTVIDNATKQRVINAVVTINGLSSAYSNAGETYFPNVAGDTDYTATITAAPSYPTTQQMIHVGPQDTQVTLSITAYSGLIKGLVNSASSFTVTLVEFSKTLNYPASDFFTFSTLAPGTYHVKIEKTGYASVIKEVTLAPNASVDLGSINITTPLPKGIGGYSTSVKKSGYGGGPSFSINYPQYVSISGHIKSGIWDPSYKVGAWVNPGLFSIWTHESSISASPYANIGTYTLKLDDYADSGSSWIQVNYNVDNEAPAISLSKTWCNSNQDVSVSLSCIDTFAGIKSFQYAITNSLTKPASFTSIPNNTAVQFTNTGVWYLHLQCTDNANYVNYLVEGPYIINK